MAMPTGRSCAPLGCGQVRLADRWVRLSLRSWLPTGYSHWPRSGREVRQPLAPIPPKTGGNLYLLPAGRCS